jgi:diguanylate cyclase (GGDEF)-like protein
MSTADNSINDAAADELLPDAASEGPQTGPVGEITADQSFNEAVADIFPQFAMAEAIILVAYAVWLAAFAPWDGFIRVVLASLALGSALAPPLLAKAAVKDQGADSKVQESAAFALSIALCNCLPALYLGASLSAAFAVGATMVVSGCLLLSSRLLILLLGSGLVAVAPAAIIANSFEPLAWVASMACLGLFAYTSRATVAEKLFVVRKAQVAVERDELSVREADLKRKHEKEREAACDLEVRAETEAFWSWDLIEDKVWFSSRWREMLGYGDDDLGEEPSKWFNIVHPHDLGRLLDSLKVHIEGDDEESFEVEHRIRQKDDSYCWVLSRGRAVRDESGKAQRILGLQVNLRRLKLFESQLLHDATHDRLTGLPNRQYLLTRLREDAERAKRSDDYKFAVVFLDLDGFKDVNDSLGHMAGDRLLGAVGRRLAESTGPEDTVARLGGDEFVILLRNVFDENDAMQRASRIQEVLLKPFMLGPQEVATRASVGIALSSIAVSQPEDLLRNADLAMYHVKTSEKGLVQIFDSEMHVKTTRLWSLQNDLRRAVERRELELYYQPQIDAKTGRICGTEALIRWHRGGDEMVSPGEFIPLAEEQGLIWEIGEWALWEACRQSVKWQQLGLRPLRVAVNLSARQLSNDGFADLIRRVLKDTGLDPKWLQVELTETALMGSLDATPANLYSLFCLGIQTAIDDFGTGYSSLDYLRRLHFDELKIDRSFISDISTDPRASALAQSIIDMAHRLQLRVVAEGVETLAQLKILEDSGCDEIQGYLASRPVPAAQMTLLLRDDARLLEMAREAAGEKITNPQIEYETEGLRTLALAERAREQAAASDYNPLAEAASTIHR